MSTAAAGDQQQTLGQILFYRQLEPLSIERHKQLGVSQVMNPFSFLADTHLVPLTVDEFGLAAVCYPIIFDTESKSPLAVMGLRPGMNVFLGADGSLDPEVYLPAFARRYPFLPIVAGQQQQQQQAQENDRVLVCIDRSAKMINAKPEQPFFEGDKPSRFTEDAIKFCREFDVLGRRTAEFINLVKEHDLFETTPLALPRAKPDGTPDEPVKVGEYLRISEKRLNELPTDNAHLLSLGLWPKILSRAARIQASTPLS
jgi:hypothetical protein